ncbi:MAG: hypothetical protein QOC63_4387 [Mycobacterium sp.]|nr:hypothetical protein [Mycobacterium sp.]
MGAPLLYRVVSAALVHSGVDLRRGRMLASIVGPLVVAEVGLGRSGKSHDCGSQSAADDGGKSEFLHYSLASRLFGRGEQFPYRVPIV